MHKRDPSPLPPALTADSRVATGKLLAIAGQIDEAVTILEAALDYAHGRHDSFAEADALDLLSWLAWIELDGERSRFYARRMLTLEVPATSSAAFRLFVRQATQLLQLGRPEAALRILEEAEEVGRDADIDSFIAYLSVKADVFAAVGQPAVALSHAKLALDIADKRSDQYQQWRRLEYYGYILYTNGRLRDSLATFEQAERVAHAASLTWEVPFSRVRAAWIASLLGQMTQARSLIVSCFAFDYDVRWMVVTRAWVGLSIGLAVGDDELVRQCSDRAHLETAFDSGDSYSLGRTVAVFHDYYLRDGNVAEANRLLERAVPLLASPDCAWPIFAAIAANGTATQIDYAHELSAKFSNHHALGQALRSWVAALSARRRGDERACQRYAGEAQLLFETNEHYYAAARALEFAGRSGEAHCRFVQMGAQYDAERTAAARSRRGRPQRSYELIRQQREVLGLLLAGQPTKAIAARLGVSIRTVKNRVSELYDLDAVSSRAELLARHGD